MTGETDARTGLGSLIGDGDFRRLWIAGGLFGIVRWMETLAISVTVYDLTGSPLLVALMTFVRMLPLLLFGTVMGTLAERLNRKRLLAGALFTLSVISASLFVLVVTGRIEIWHMALGAFLSGTFWSMDLPVRRTILGDVAGRSRMSSAMGIDSTTNHATRMLGPALGGLVLDTVGLHGAYLAGAVLFVVAGLLASGLKQGGPRAAGIPWTMAGNIVEGFRYVRSQPLLVGTLSVTVIVNFWGFAFVSVVPAMGREELALSAFLIGMLVSSEASGAFLTSLAIAIIGPRRNLGILYLSGSALFLTAVLLFSLSSWFALCAALLFIAGCGFAGFAVMQSTITYLAAPANLRSRVMGTVTLCIGLGLLGMLHVGFLADMVGASTAITIIAIEGLVALAASTLIWPDLRRRDMAAKDTDF
jgi:predicted MFS family arabinose efflux permease